MQKGYLAVWFHRSTLRLTQSKANHSYTDNIYTYTVHHDRTMSLICEVHVQDVITQSPPSVILMELTPSQMQAVGLADAATLLQQLYDLGYTDISHSGYASAGSITLLIQPHLIPNLSWAVPAAE